MDLNLEATELRLGLPGAPSCSGKRSSTEMNGNPVQKQQVVGWPPVRSYRKSTFLKKVESSENSSGMFVKVSMDGAPYLRKIDLNFYDNYADLLKALENMFKCDLGVQSEREGYSDHAPTYEDKDGDWMLVGDVPWEMFITSCQRMRIMKGSEARGLQIQQLFTK